jgi:hypothetical protein
MSMIGNLLRVSQSELESYIKDSSLLEERIYNSYRQDPKLVIIDKSWEGIIFLIGQNIANADHPLLKVLFSGQLIDEEQDLGYGPAHYLTPEQVSDLNNEIMKITDEDMKNRFDFQKMTELEVYPTVWDKDDFGYLVSNFEIVKKIYLEATKNNEGIITFIN